MIDLGCSRCRREHVCRVVLGDQSPRIASSSSTLRIRAGLSAKRSSSINSGCPIVANSRSVIFWFDPDSATYESSRPWRLAVRDLEASVRPGVSAVAIPKVASADHLRELDDVVTELETVGGIELGATRFIVMVETCAAFARIEQIAAASPRNAAITLGGEDFALDAGIKPEPDLLIGPKQRTVFAARAAGIRPLGLVGSISQFADLDAFAGVVAQSRRVGFTGASVIHPAQVAVVNRGFSPSDEEVQWATGALAAYQTALAEHRGAAEYAGAMVDEPVARRAARIVAMADRKA